MEMYLNKDWYPEITDLKNKSDKGILFEFLEALPKNFEQFFNPRTSNLLEITPRSEVRFLSRIHLSKSFREASKVFSDHFNSEMNPWLFDDTRMDELESAGLTKDSLRVKISLLNSLWHRITKYVANRGMRFLNFLDDGLRNLLSDFIRFLNVFMKSLRALFPQVEVFCELGEVILGVPLLA